MKRGREICEGTGRYNEEAKYVWTGGKRLREGGG